MKNRLFNQASDVASAGLSLGVLGLTTSLMLMGCSDRHRDAGNVVTPTATNVQSDTSVAESTDHLPAGMPATSIEDSSTSGATTAADADTASANTDTTTKKTASHKMHKRHMNHASAHSSANHRASKATEPSAPSEAAPATATGSGTDSGSTSSANSDMSGSTSAHVEDGFLSAPGRKASALTDQGVVYRIDDAAAASTLQ